MVQSVKPTVQEQAMIDAAAQDERSIAISVGHAMPEAVAKEIGSLVLIGEQVKAGPVKLYLMLDAAKFDWSKVPVPGSSYLDKPKTNALTEVFQAWDTDKQENVELNYFTLAFRETSTAHDYLAHIEDAKLRLDGNDADGTHYKDKVGDDFYLNDQITLYQGRMASGKKYYRDACRIGKKMEVLEAIEGVRVDFNTEPDGKGGTRLASTKRPFILVNTDDTAKQKYLTGGDLLRMKPDVAAKASAEKKEHIYYSLIGTTKKAKGTNLDPQNAQIDQLVKSFDKSLDMMYGLGLYYDPEHEGGEKHKAALLAACKRDKTKRKIVGDLCIILDDVWGAIQADYNADSRGENAEAKETEAA